ncbi:unnamed protein product [Phytophthora lilii]|uniref:beta-glucosidase n=1 Tax=Phytophthora lilii TaxID=2077276 RepID=A0A9W6TPG5_9STRA|nr:unnamed protein product [Phytophthora lilii]
MSMTGFGWTFTNGTNTLIEKTPSIMDRLKESVRRILKLKLKLGLYDTPVPGAKNLELVGNDDDVAAALKFRESIVLLQNNDSTLPLPTNASVFLTGPSANNIGYQCGGWTLIGQGVSGNDMYAHGFLFGRVSNRLLENNSFSAFLPDGSAAKARW